MHRLRSLRVKIAAPTLAGEAAIAAALSALTALTRLTAQCLTGGDGTSAWQHHIAHELRCCTALRELSLCEQTLTPQWVSAPSVSLGACSQLTRLMIIVTWADEEGADISLRPLYSALSGCRQLETLECSMCKTVDGATALCAALQQHASLRELSINYNITEEEQAPVRARARAGALCGIHILALLACWHSVQLPQACKPGVRGRTRSHRAHQPACPPHSSTTVYRTPTL